MNELPSVLWTFRTITRWSTGETPYSLAYETEDVIPLEVGLLILRVMQVEARGNDVALEEALDFAMRKEKSLLFGWPTINRVYPSKGVVNWIQENFRLAVWFSERIWAHWLIQHIANFLQIGKGHMPIYSDWSHLYWCLLPKRSRWKRHSKPLECVESEKILSPVALVMQW